MSDYEISTIRYAKTIYKHQNKTRSLPKNLNEIHAKLTTKNLNKKQKVIKAKENNKNSEVIDYEQYPLPSHVKKVEKVMRSELKKEAANKKKEKDNRDSQVKLNTNYKMSEILPDLEQEKELLSVYQMSPVQAGGRFGGV